MVKDPIVNLTKNTSNFSKVPIAIVLHRTASYTAKRTLDTWKNTRTYGTHFLIDKDGTMYQCASLHKWTQHIGKTISKAYPTNSISIGIEVVAWYDQKNQKWDEATIEQKASLKKLIEALLDFYKITKHNIYEQGKISHKTAGEGANLYP